MNVKQYLGVRLVICLLLAFAPRLLSAQEDNTRFVRDSIQAQPEFNEPRLVPFEHSAEKTASSVSPTTEKAPSVPRFSLNNPLYLPYYTNPSPLFRGDYSTSGTLMSLPHGALFASGGQTTLPGIGRFNEASVGYQHIFNPRLMLQLGVDATKINMSHITGQAFSTSGSLLYQASDKVAFRLFGSYAIGNTYGINTHSYGATMKWDMSQRFSLEMGAQRYYNAYRGRWETVPVVIPTYNFDKFKLGLDVGGILYEVLRNVVFDNKRNSGGPTIAPPRF